MKRFACVMAVALVCATRLSFAIADDEQRDEDKSLASWISGLASDDPQIRQAADEELSAKYERILFEPPDFDDADEFARQETARAELKPHSAALLTLLDCRHDGSRATAAWLLALIGTDASEAEMALLKIIRSKETSGHLLYSAITALLHVTPRNRPVGPALLEAYDDAGGGAVDDRKREKAAESNRDDEHEIAAAGISAVALALTLAQSGRAAIEAPSLVKLASAKYRCGIRLTAIYALAELEGEVISAVPALRKMSSDEDVRIRSAAGSALLRIEGNPESLAAMLNEMQLGESETAEFRTRYSEYIQERMKLVQAMGDDFRERLPEISRQLTCRNPFYQRQAIRLLGEIGPAAKEAVPALHKAAKSDDKFTRDTALAALRRIEPGR